MAAATDAGSLPADLMSEWLPGAGAAVGGGGRRLACPDCGKTYRWRDSLRRHQRVECGKEPTHCCPFCLYRFKHRFHLNAHIRDSCPKRRGGAASDAQLKHH